MKKLIVLGAAFILTGCANVNGVLTPTLLADYYDSQDPCQLQNIKGSTTEEKIRNMPSFCGASKYTRVQSYVRKDGTYVRSHIRNLPN